MTNMTSKAPDSVAQKEDMAPGMQPPTQHSHGGQVALLTGLLRYYRDANPAS